LTNLKVHFNCKFIITDEFDKSLEAQTKQETSTLYSEFQQAAMDFQEFDFKDSDISSFLIRTGAPVETLPAKIKKNKSKFATIDKIIPKDDKSEASIGLPDDDENKIIPKEIRNSILNTEEEGEINKLDESR